MTISLIWIRPINLVKSYGFISRSNKKFVSIKTSQCVDLWFATFANFGQFLSQNVRTNIRPFVNIYESIGATCHQHIIVRHVAHSQGFVSLLVHHCNREMIIGLALHAPLLNTAIKWSCKDSRLVGIIMLWTHNRSYTILMSLSCELMHKRLDHLFRIKNIIHLERIHVQLLLYKWRLKFRIVLLRLLLLKGPLIHLFGHFSFEGINLETSSLIFLLNLRWNSFWIELIFWGSSRMVILLNQHGGLLIVSIRSLFT